jgi:hypothetical protein
MAQSWDASPERKVAENKRARPQYNQCKVVGAAAPGSFENALVRLKEVAMQQVLNACLMTSLISSAWARRRKSPGEQQWIGVYHYPP